MFAIYQLTGNERNRYAAKVNGGLFNYYFRTEGLKKNRKKESPEAEL